VLLRWPDAVLPVLLAVVPSSHNTATPSGYIILSQPMLGRTGLPLQPVLVRGVGLQASLGSLFSKKLGKKTGAQISPQPVLEKKKEKKGGRAVATLTTAPPGGELRQVF